jgi:transposase InsO family protein
MPIRSGRPPWIYAPATRSVNCKPTRGSGEYRMHGALLQLGIRLSPRTCGRIMAENRQLYGLTKPHAEKKEPKPHPFTARFRHEIWSLDIRYIEKHQIPEIKGPFYVISVMDNFSRAILASDIYQAQDLASGLIVLYAAIEQHGCPRRLVTDNGSVFRAKQAMAIYDALEIQKEWIHKKQSWENLIESHFYVTWNYPSCYNSNNRIAPLST